MLNVIPLLMIPINTVTVVFVVYFQTRPITDVKCYTVTNDTNHRCYCRVRCLFSDKTYNECQHVIPLLMIPISTFSVVFVVYFQIRRITNVKCYTITNDTNHHLLSCSLFIFRQGI